MGSDTTSMSGEFHLPETSNFGGPMVTLRVKGPYPSCSQSHVQLYTKVFKENFIVLGEYTYFQWVNISTQKYTTLIHPSRLLKGPKNKQLLLRCVLSTSVCAFVCLKTGFKQTHDFFILLMVEKAPFKRMYKIWSNKKQWEKIV